MTRAYFCATLCIHRIAPSATAVSAARHQATAPRSRRTQPNANTERLCGLADGADVSAGKIMSRIRRHLIVSRADPVAEMASEVREGLETLARAICALAVERHAKDPGHHRELAAVLFIDCMNNFHDVKIRPEMRDWMAKLLNIDPRNTEKWANRR